MKVISEADVVFALGTRLGPFGSLPQYEFDYWPKNAKIIQVDIASRRLGLTKDVDIGKYKSFFLNSPKKYQYLLILQKNRVKINHIQHYRRLYGFMASLP